MMIFNNILQKNAQKIGVSAVAPRENHGIMKRMGAQRTYALLLKERSV